MRAVFLLLLALPLVGAMLGAMQPGQLKENAAGAMVNAMNAKNMNRATTAAQAGEGAVARGLRGLAEEDTRNRAEQETAVSVPLTYTEVDGAVIAKYNSIFMAPAIPSPASRCGGTLCQHCVAKGDTCEFGDALLAGGKTAGPVNNKACADYCKPAGADGKPCAVHPFMKELPLGQTIVEVQPDSILYHYSIFEIKQFDDGRELYVSPDLCQALTYALGKPSDAGADEVYLYKFKVQKKFHLLRIDHQAYPIIYPSAEETTKMFAGGTSTMNSLREYKPADVAGLPNLVGLQGFSSMIEPTAGYSSKGFCNWVKKQNEDTPAAPVFGWRQPTDQNEIHFCPRDGLHTGDAPYLKLVTVTKVKVDWDGSHGTFESAAGPSVKLNRANTCFGPGKSKTDEDCQGEQGITGNIATLNGEIIGTYGESKMALWQEHGKAAVANDVVAGVKFEIEAKMDLEAQKAQGPPHGFTCSIDIEAGDDAQKAKALQLLASL